MVSFMRTLKACTSMIELQKEPVLINERKKGE